MTKASFVALLLSLVVSFFYMNSLNKTAQPMANNGLFFVSNAAKVHNVCQKALEFVRKVLYIKIYSSEPALPLLSKQITNLYTKATTQCSSLDIRLLLKTTVMNVKTSHPIDVILYDGNLSKEIDKLKQAGVYQNPRCTLQCIDTFETLESCTEEPVATYEYVAVGGTFDRLHNGHKILLSQAVLRATKHLTVGVTDLNMIQSKKLWELIEPVDQRIKAVLNFLTDINPDIEYNVLPIQDMYGPTKDDSRFQMIVVSEETSRAVPKINEKRKENGLEPLASYMIGLARDDLAHVEEEAKVSSSNQRMRLLGTVLKPPVPNPDIPDWPYVIGLAGGIASGKSSIAEKLKAKGAAIVNCDLIAHSLYLPGQPLNRTIADTFGNHIITESGEVDRRVLGQIVFSDQKQLEKLNQIIWPEIIKEAEQRIRVLGQQGVKVVVMEAAVMVRAKWYMRCHQLWSVIIPAVEAVNRLQTRNGLSAEEAKQRIASQPSNIEQVAPANIVFSPYWSYDYTQAQVDRAWDNLQRYLQERENSKL